MTEAFKVALGILFAVSIAGALIGSELAKGVLVVSLLALILLHGFEALLRAVLGNTRSADEDGDGDE